MFRRNPWKIVATLTAICGASVAAIGGTYANFTATPTTITSNAFASGTLTMTRSGSGAVFTASNMKIGDSATGSVTITNTGSLAGVYSLSDAITGSAPLAAQIHTVIYKDNDNVVGSKIYDGSLSASAPSPSAPSRRAPAHTSSTSTSTCRRPVRTPGTTPSRAFPRAPRFTWSATQA